MNELLEQYATYNIWANEKLTEILHPLGDDVVLATFPSSFSSIHATLLHMWDAESIWWQRMKLQEVIVAPSTTFKGSTLDVSTSLIHQTSNIQHPTLHRTSYI